MIPVNKPLISSNAQKYINDCVKTGWVSSSGKYIELFEHEFAKYLGIKYAVTVTSGTAALHLALSALNISEGDEIIIPDLTIISCAFAAIYTGAIPVFVDVNPITGTLDTEKIEEKITKKTKAIMVVHLYGYPAEMDSIKRLAKKYKLIVIEDAAEALGCEYKGVKVGSLSDIGCFSFYANKLITTGEGGMIVTNNEITYKRLKSLKNLAHSNTRRFVHNMIGFNYRMTNLQAALGLAELENIENHIKKKDWIFDQYQKGLSNNRLIQIPVNISNIRYICWMFTIMLSKNSKLSKKKLQEKLFRLGVDTREYFIPMHQQPILKELKLVDKKTSYPISSALSARGFYIPSGLALTKTQIITVTNAINKILTYD